jgi:hypothetical protein
MAKPSKSFEQQLWELAALRDAALDECARNDRVCQATALALGRSAREHYPALGSWEPEPLRQLADRVSWYASQFAHELSKLAYRGEH